MTAEFAERAARVGTPAYSVDDQCQHHLPLQDSIERYVTQRVPVGDFLTAVLSNNLVEAFARADTTNRPLLAGYAEHLYWCLPSPCWGSPSKVRDWLANA